MYICTGGVWNVDGVADGSQSGSMLDDSIWVRGIRWVELDGYREAPGAKDLFEP